MALSPGDRLGPYDIAGPLGAGGMGEVYRARDTTLNRNVALKILPDAFASDPDRMARFTREAQTLAALNHPHIAQIYGIHDGQHNGARVRALVMELVEGKTSQRACRAAHSRSMRRWQPPSRSPKHSRPRMNKASSTAI